jgi:hypothetical protein
MDRDFRWLAAAGGLLVALSVGGAAYAQKQGGVLKIYFFDTDRIGGVCRCFGPFGEVHNTKTAGKYDCLLMNDRD